MKLIWYLSSFTTMFLILLNSPKSNSFGDFSNQSQFFSYTKSTKQSVQLVTILSGLIFLFVTIILTGNWLN